MTELMCVAPPRDSPQKAPLILSTKQLLNKWLIRLERFQQQSAPETMSRIHYLEGETPTRSAVGQAQALA
jgi:hypothetical protein